MKTGNKKDHAHKAGRRDRNRDESKRGTSKHDEHHKEEHKKRHSDGYRKSQTLDITVAEGIHSLSNDTLPLSSEPAPRADLDPFIKIEGSGLFNGGMQTIYNNFRTVDYDAGVAADDQNVESTFCDYVQSDVYFPMQILYPGLSNFSFEDGNRGVFNGFGPNLNQGYASLTTPGANLVNDQFTKLTALFQANLSYSGAPLMSATCYALNDGAPLAMNGEGDGTDFTPGTINPIFAIHEAIQQSMLYLVTRLRMGSVDRYLYKYFANKHVALSSALMQVYATTQSLRGRSLLDRAKDLLAQVPCDVEYIENYAKRALPSRTGNSWYDPILIPTLTFAVPTYQVQTGPGEPLFTLGPENANYLNEYSLEDGYDAIDGAGMREANPYYGEQSNVGGDDNDAEMNLYFLNNDNRTAYLTPRSIALLQALENDAANNVASDGPEVFQTEVQNYTAASLQDLQELVDDCSRLVAMATTYIGFGQLTKRSNLTKLDVHSGEGDFDVSYHYDGMIWDGIKHPEVYTDGEINESQQYTTHIAVENDHYDGHLVDGVSMYSCTSEAFLDTMNDDNDGYIIGITPFHITTGMDPGAMQPTADMIYNNITHNLFKLPVCLVADGVYPTDFVNNTAQFNILDYDEHDGNISYYNGQVSYGQQFGQLPNNEVNHLPLSFAKYLGIVGAIDGDENLEYLYNYTYTSLMPVTVMNPILKLQEGAMNHMPFVTTLKTDAHKVIQSIA